MQLQFAAKLPSGHPMPADQRRVEPNKPTWTAPTRRRALAQPSCRYFFHKNSGTPWIDSEQSAHQVDYRVGWSAPILGQQKVLRIGKFNPVDTARAGTMCAAYQARNVQQHRLGTQGSALPGCPRWILERERPAFTYGHAEDKKRAAKGKNQNAQIVSRQGAVEFKRP